MTEHEHETEREPMTEREPGWLNSGRRRKRPTVTLGAYP
jgi:hypothetical protein